MKKLIVVAEKEELGLVEKLGFKGIPALITGVGALNVINALKDVPKDVEIINVGHAGSKNLEPDKFYGVSSVTLNHPNVPYEEPTYGCKTYDNSKYEEKKCYTGCDFVLQSDIEDCLFDMELAYIAALGFEDVRSYKYVSDNLDLQEYRKTLNEQK